MQTVQFQCGNCGKLMAVGTEHLGSQVHCPHCMEIVQAPSAPAAPPPPEPPPIPEIRVRPPDVEEGSIFGGNSDDNMFTAPRGPMVEMPSSPVAAPSPAPPRFEAVPAEPHPTASNHPPPDATAAFTPEKHWADAAAHQEESALPAQDLSRYKQSSSMLVPMLLIFLIPYSVVCTAYIVWSLIHPPGSSFDPLQLLRDPKPGDGGPVRVKPDAPLPGKLKTSLNEPIQVGDTEVTPFRIMLANDDLVLYLKMRNLSKDLKYNPLPDSFGKHTEKGQVPYTFLDTGKDKFYGGYVEWRKNGHKDRSGIIGPGEENITLLTTYDKYRKSIPALLRSREQLVWRVQVRRGFFNLSGKDVSTTGVVGVIFSPQAIEKGAVEAATQGLRESLAQAFSRGKP